MIRLLVPGLCFLILILVGSYDVQASTGNPSIDLSCPCNASWKNHGQYVSCVADAAKNIISEKQRGEIVSTAAKSSCGKKSTDNQVLATTTQRVFATQGATLTLPSGEKLVIPPGALAQDTKITLQTVVSTIQLPPGFKSDGPVVELLPDGLTFAPNIPALLTLPIMSPNIAEATDLIYLLDENDLIPVSLGEEDSEGPNQPIDFAQNTITAQLSHFSKYGKFVRLDVGDWWTKQAIGTVGSTFLAPLSLFTYKSSTGGFQCLHCETTRPGTDIKKIIVHSTNTASGTTFLQLISGYFSNIGKPGTYIDADGVHSYEPTFATYYIDTDGRILQLADDTLQTNHALGNNPGTIGIELFEGKSTWTSWTTPPPPRGPGYSSDQIKALDILVAQLRLKYPTVPSNGVCMHRDLDERLDHQDPYQLSNVGWQEFLTRLSLVPCNSIPQVCPLTATARVGIGAPSIPQVVAISYADYLAGNYTLPESGALAVYDLQTFTAGVNTIWPVDLSAKGYIQSCGGFCGTSDLLSSNPQGKVTMSRLKAGEFSLTNGGTFADKSVSRIGLGGEWFWSSSASIDLGYTEQLTVNSPTRAGQNGTLILNYQAAGNFSCTQETDPNAWSGRSGGNTRYAIHIGASAQSGALTCPWAIDGSPQLTGVRPIPSAVEIPFVYGSPFQVPVSISMVSGSGSNVFNTRVGMDLSAVTYNRTNFSIANSPSDAIINFHDCGSP